MSFSDYSNFKNLLSTNKISIPEISKTYASYINIPNHSNYVLVYGLKEDFQGINDFIENLIKKTSIKIIRKEFRFPDSATKFCIQERKDAEVFFFVFILFFLLYIYPFII